MRSDTVSIEAVGVSHRQSQELMEMIRRKRIQGEAREFDEREDAEFVKMKMVAIWEAQETMERGVVGRRNSPDFLA
jgi:hypothetical protein